MSAGTKRARSRCDEAGINKEANMKLKLIGLALAATFATAGFAYADSVTVQSGGTTSGVVVKERTHPGVVVHEHATVGAGIDCSKKKVTHKNELTGTKVTKTTKNCD
jgi:hypothetical protein